MRQRDAFGAPYAGVSCTANHLMSIRSLALLHTSSLEPYNRKVNLFYAVKVNMKLLPLTICTTILFSSHALSLDSDGSLGQITVNQCIEMTIEATKDFRVNMKYLQT